MYAFHPYEARLVVTLIPGSCGTYMDNKKSTENVAKALDEFKFCRLDKYFYGATDYDKVPLCKTLYFVRVTGLMTE
jgi:hypothetical protein